MTARVCRPPNHLEQLMVVSVVYVDSHDDGTHPIESLLHHRRDAQLPGLSARSARRVAIGYSVALRIASAASRLLGFVAGGEAAAGVFSLFLMSGLPSARGNR
jgi:hypothetical protein